MASVTLPRMSVSPRTEYWPAKPQPCRQPPIAEPTPCHPIAWAGDRIERKRHRNADFQRLRSHEDCHLGDVCQLRRSSGFSHRIGERDLWTTNLDARDRAVGGFRPKRHHLTTDRGCEGGNMSSSRWLFIALFVFAAPAAAQNFTGGPCSASSMHGTYSLSLNGRSISPNGGHHQRVRGRRYCRFRRQEQCNDEQYFQHESIRRKAIHVFRYVQFGVELFRRHYACARKLGHVRARGMEQRPAI